VFVHKRVSPVMPFLYANARIQARSSYLLNENDFKNLSEIKSLTELVSALDKTDYAEEIEKAEDVRSLDAAIEKSFIKTLNELKSVSPKEFNELLDAYLMFWEAKVLKTIYRVKSMKRKETEEELKELVFEVGRIDYSLLKHLLEAETLADMKVVMSSTVYGKVFEAEYASLEEFEVALDNFVFDFFVEKTTKTKMFEAKEIVELLNAKFDVMNLMVLLKAKTRGLTKTEEIKKLLIKNNTPLYELFEELIEAENLDQVVELCKNLSYHEALAEALNKFKQDKSLSHFETEFWRHYKEFVIGSELYHPQGPYPLFSYLTKKEIEQKNLMIISKGIDLGMEAKQMQELIV
jgi:V/A-type H+-transporting ATPase subunit C